MFLSLFYYSAEHLLQAKIVRKALFLLDFGLSGLTSLQFIQYHLAGFYKPTITQSVPSHLQNYSIQYATMVSNSQPFSYDSSALTTRTRLLAKIYFCLSNFLRIKYSKRNLIYFYFLTFNTKVKF